jgi:hypothetical protein
MWKPREQGVQSTEAQPPAALQPDALPPAWTLDARDTKRVNVVFSAQQYETLRELASRQGINISDALRQAINIAKLVVDANQDGKILIQRRNGEMQQLKLV